MKLHKLLTAGLCAALMATSPMLHASAARQTTRYFGDVDLDRSVGVSDLILLQKYLLGLQPITSEKAAICADVDQDGVVDIMDLAMLKRYVLNGTLIPVGSTVTPTETTTEPTEETTAPTQPPTTETTTEPTEPTTQAPTTEPPTTEATTTETPTTEPPATEAPTTERVTEPTEAGDFIDAPIYDLYGSMPSQGKANLVVFYVDFPDCPYTYEPSIEELTNYCFGTEDNTADPNYPFNTMHCFYNRSSKGALDLTGTVIRYTTQNEKSYYENDEYKIKLVEEIYKNLKSQYNFENYDADNDGYIDATLISVPKAAGDENWWPCAGQFAESLRADGKYVGHLIYGNAEVKSATDHVDFCSSYLHEMGHCMGLPDYYLYYSEDIIGMHGSAGSELMDADAYSDLGAFSKLMLGWYGENQVQVFDQNAGGTQTFSLANAQSDAGNCLILPCGTLDNNYFSEYMIIEYITEDGNNSRINQDYWWVFSVKPGIRIYHIYADVTVTRWYSYFTYENGSEESGGDDDGIRLIRLANDAEGGSVFTTGDVIDGSISGFHWYDANQGETVDT
ncbi:MAG: hypothetical protein II916_07575, partial [Oscillospiraceae bacterium]|nr:hypothetical protein [Oscillospiraceae bacterium]